MVIHRNPLLLPFLKLILLLSCLTVPALAEEIPMSVARLGIDLESHDPVVILENKEKGKTLSITIGPFEATAIAMALEGTKFPRPLSHDLMKSVIEALRAKLDRIVIHDVKEDTFYAKLCLTDSAGAALEIDARPSDSIALALRTRSPIYVTEVVLSHPSSNPTRARQARLQKPHPPSPAEKRRQRALELVREGEKLGAATFTTKDGGFDPFQDTTGNCYRKAIQKYDEALKLCPNLSQAFAARSTAWYFLRNIPAARRDARTALKLGNLRARELTLLSAPFQGEEARTVTRTGMKLVGPSDPVYYDLWLSLAQTYWYQGDFTNYVKELEAVLAWQRAEGSRYTDTTFMLLGPGYENSGNLQRAEEIYKETGQGDSLVRLYLHQERWPEARAALRQYSGQFEPDEISVFSAGIDELEGTLQSITTEQMAAAQRIGRNGSYYSFFLGLFQLRDGKPALGRETLEAFCQTCKSNPREWGVTLAWEVRRAERILNGQ